MPAVHYYLGRPAPALIAAMSRRGPARAAADVPAVAAPASPRAVPAEASAPTISAAPESTWAGHFWSPAPVD
jgi:hypothetical protein